MKGRPELTGNRLWKTNDSGAGMDVISYIYNDIDQLLTEASTVTGTFTSLYEASRVTLWVYGHTHHCVDYRLGETRVLANQRGYPDAFCKDFDPGLVLEL